MQVTETLNEGLKRSYSITLEAGVVEEKMTAKLDAARADFHMKGFRKGKVPPALMKKLFGKSMLGEAMQEVVDDAIQAHFKESGDRPALQPEIRITNEKWAEGEDLTLEMSYEKMPEVPEVDFSALKLERLVVEVDDAAIEEALENLASSAETYEPKEGPAEKGDQIVFDFVGRIDGEAFDGGAAEDFPLVLGSESFIPGFEEQLIGVEAGTQKDVTVTFPEDYGAKNLAGKEAVFSCTVKEVRRPVPAPIDDALAEKYGAENLDDLRSQISERLEQEYRDAARAVLKRKLMDQLDETVSFTLPESLVEEEAKSVAHQLWHEEHPEEEGHDHGEIEPTEEHRRLAERRVRLGLLLADAGQKAEVQVSETELNQAIMRQAMRYRGREKEYFDFARQNEQIVQAIRAPIFEDKVIDYILELAQVTDRSVSRDELQKAVEALDED
ncbi:MAG: trigger factor [Alphaproteobacteria bacterium]|nr:MAG: trigger factor [Alphaproteobacteria bacterium]